MIVINHICFLFSFAMNQVKPLQLMLLKKNRKSSLKKINSTMKIHHIKKTINSFLKLLSLLSILPIRRTSQSFQHFISQLPNNFSKTKISQHLTLEILLSKSKLKEYSTENRDKNKESYHSLKDSSNI